MKFVSELSGSVNNTNVEPVIPGEVTAIAVTAKGGTLYVTQDKANAVPNTGGGVPVPDGITKWFFDGFANLEVGSSGSVSYVISCYKG